MENRIKVGRRQNIADTRVLPDGVFAVMELLYMLIVVVVT